MVHWENITFLRQPLLVAHVLRIAPIYRQLKIDDIPKGNPFTKHFPENKKKNKWIKICGHSTVHKFPVREKKREPFLIRWWCARPHNFTTTLRSRRQFTVREILRDTVCTIAHFNNYCVYFFRIQVTVSALASILLKWNSSSSFPIFFTSSHSNQYQM